MTSTVAVTVAGAAVLLALLVLWLVTRLQRVTRELSAQLSEVQGEQARLGARLEQASAEHTAALRAVELELQESRERESAHAGGDDGAVPVITDISDRFGGTAEDDLTTARIASVTLGGPLIKVAAFSHGVRHALDEEQRMRISYAVRKELRRQRKMRRRRRTEQSRSREWRR